MKPYVIQQGDHLTKLAFQMGFDAEQVWSDPANAELRQKRTDKDVLCPGDVVFVPDGPRRALPLQGGTSNRYEAKVPTAEVRLKLAKAGAPIAGETYRVEGAGRPIEGVTDSEGGVSFAVPVHTREVDLVLPSRNTSYHVRVGNLDPASEPSGVKSRLAQLGYLGHPLPEGFDEAARRALAAFQRAEGLPATGEPDDATRAALAKKFGR
jgi:hypothetical protein